MLKLHLRFKFTLIGIIVSLGVCSQEIYKECELDFSFEYFPYDVEDPELGISMFNIYSPVLSNKSKLRKNNQNHVLAGKHIDYYKGGNKMHVGLYADGRLLGFKNYYNNGNTERELKLKKEKPIRYLSYYPNENIRELKEFSDEVLVKHEFYFSNESLKHGKYFKKSGTLEKEERLDEKGGYLKRVELITGTTDMYTISNKTIEDMSIDTAVYRYNASTSKYVKHGRYVKYSEDGEIVSEIIYKNGGVLEVVIEENLRSNVPAKYIAFDKDNNGEISQKEINFVVNDFFDGENSISLDEINNLVNYFFEQD